MHGIVVEVNLGNSSLLILICLSVNTCIKKKKSKKNKQTDNEDNKLEKYVLKFVITDVYVKKERQFIVGIIPLKIVQLLYFSQIA